jgi:hypothetical protein
MKISFLLRPLFSTKFIVLDEITSTNQDTLSRCKHGTSSVAFGLNSYARICTHLTAYGFVAEANRGSIGVSEMWGGSAENFKQLCVKQPYNCFQTLSSRAWGFLKRLKKKCSTPHWTKCIVNYVSATCESLNKAGSSAIMFYNDELFQLSLRSPVVYAL